MDGKTLTTGGLIGLILAFLASADYTVLQPGESVGVDEAVHSAVVVERDALLAENDALKVEIDALKSVPVQSVTVEPVCPEVVAQKAEIARLEGLRDVACADPKQAKRCARQKRRIGEAELVLDELNAQPCAPPKEASKSMVNITDVNVANPGEGSSPIKDGSVNVRLFTDVDPVDVFAAQFESKGRTQQMAVTNLSLIHI